MQVGLYLHRPLDKDNAWRAVSEGPGRLYRPTSFLLIVPTCHIFTAHDHNLFGGCDHKASSAGFRDVPAYSQVLQQPG
jgi:hypothetical protein